MKMNPLAEVVQFARRMVREMIDGFIMARRWLRNLGYSLELQAAILARA
jgi:hypothetical protein